MKRTKQALKQDQIRMLAGITDIETREVMSRYFADHERLANAETLEDLVAVLDDILPFWKRHHISHTFDAECTLHSIRAAIVLHDRTTMTTLPPVPRDLAEVDGWAVSVRKLLKLPAITLKEIPKTRRSRAAAKNWRLFAPDVKY